MKILVSGSSGLVGSALISFLENQKHQHEVYRLVRARADLKPKEIAWDPHSRVISPEVLEGFDAVVHLAGENIMGLWTESKKKRIKESRVLGTKVLSEALSRLKNPPAILVCASAVGYYGNRGNEILTEQSPKGVGFLADVCQEWEEATRPAAEKGIRVVNLRFGMVLSPKGGALKLMLPIFKLGLGGRMGSGDQYTSWIAIDDLIRLIDEAIHRNNLIGPVNAVSPRPITNQEFTKIMGKELHRPTFLSVPAFMIKLLFGEFGQEVFLNSARVEPQKLNQIGFSFEYPTLESALEKYTSSR